METDRIENAGSTTQSEQFSENAYYGGTEAITEDDGGESDTPPEMDAKNSCSSDSASSLKPQNARTPRIQRMSMKANNPAMKTSVNSVSVRKTGTKESIDRSTCSTVVGSTYGDSSQCQRRRRQGSDLSAMSHCSEGSENRHDQSHNNIHKVEESGGEDDGEPSDEGERQVSPRIRRISFPGKPKAAPSHPEKDTSGEGPEEGDQPATEHPCDADKSVEAAEGLSSIQPPPLSVSGSQTSSSLSAPEELEDDPSVEAQEATDKSRGGDAHNDNDAASSSSSDDEIVYHLDDSSSESEHLGSLQIVDSTMNLFGASDDDDSTTRKNRNQRNTPQVRSWHQRRREYFSPEFKRMCVKNFNTCRLICGKIVNNVWVQNFIVFLIIANALFMGVSTFDFVDGDPRRRMVFDRLDLAFLIAFTFESAFQLIFHGRNLFEDGWLTFDFLVVILSWCFASMQVFRTMRSFRLIARVQILRQLIEALMEACPRLTGIMFLFLLIMYIYAVMITVLFGEMWEKGQTEKDYFSRLDTTLFTLFQMITLDWASIVREVMVVYPLSWAIFSTYLSFTSFILFSLVIGVVCDAVSAIEHDANLVEILEQKEQAHQRIMRLQHQVDYLKKQQKSVLASVQIVLDEIVEQERKARLNPRESRSRFVLEKPQAQLNMDATDRKWVKSDSSSDDGGYGETTAAVIQQHLSAFG
jgi:voltage-gated sodium channel